MNNRQAKADDPQTADSVPVLKPAFVLLFAVTPDAARQDHALPQGLQAIPEALAESYRSRLDAMLQRLLGEPYLQARRLTGATDVHAQANDTDDAPLPRNTLPLLVTLELLCLEHAVLRSFLNRFAQGVYGTTEDLVQLRRDIFDGLEEYYGTLAKTHGHHAGHCRAVGLAAQILREEPLSAPWASVGNAFRADYKGRGACPACNNVAQYKCTRWGRAVSMGRLCGSL